MIRFRSPSLIEIFWQFLLLLFVCLYVYDFSQAFNATACGIPSAEANCYPWGAEAMAERWDYASKEAYLLSALLQISVLLIALIQPFITSRPQIGLLRLAVIGVAGTVILQPQIFGF